MRTPTVELTRTCRAASRPRTIVQNWTRSTKCDLLDFDGRNGKLNADNVLFVGDTGISRAVLETAAKDAGQELNGSEAAVLIDNRHGRPAGHRRQHRRPPSPTDTATNSSLSTVAERISRCTVTTSCSVATASTPSTAAPATTVSKARRRNGTDTWDTLDGGKNYYAVQVLGEPQARVYTSTGGKPRIRPRSPRCRA